MKKIKYYIATLFLLSLIGFTSCNDTYEFHEQYTIDGEIVYTNKVDSLTVLPGNNRLQIDGYISNAFNVNEITVYWDKGENSQVFTYEKSTEDTDKINLIINDLEERAYEFEVYTSDTDGNKSVKVITFGSAYGETYRSNLSPRAVNTFNFDVTEGSATIEFKGIEDLTRNTEIKFTNTDGAEMISILIPAEKDIVLEALDITKDISFRTLYVPTASDEETGEETSIDQFPSDWKQFTLPAIVSILESVELIPNLGGTDITWSNPNNINNTLSFTYTVDGGDITSDITSNDSEGSASLSGMEAVEQSVFISISDAYGNSFGTIEKTVQPKAVVKFDRTDWTIVDFSSEEPYEANWGPEQQGSARAILDGDSSTFWHTAWAYSQPIFPHHVTIDMGEEKTIASFEFFTRENKTDGATVHEFWVSSDNITFTKVADLNAAMTTNDAYSVNAAPNTTGRYVKYLAVEGSSTHTYLSEFNVYGVE